MIPFLSNLKNLISRTSKLESNIGYASMYVNEVTHEITSTEPDTSDLPFPVTDYWSRLYEYGGFSFDDSGFIAIGTHTSMIEVSGQIAGYGNVTAEIVIIDGSAHAPSTYNIQSVGLLHQPSGNKYWRLALPKKVIKLNNLDKDHYVWLRMTPYNGGTFYINSGFGPGATWIQVKKIC